MKKIIYKTKTGIAVITPSASAIRNKMPMEKIITDSHIPEGSEFKIIDESEMPKDYSEFKGFEGLQSALNYDMTLDVERAKEIKKAKLRHERVPKFADLDKEYMLADETQDDVKKADVIASKQRLRDITKLVDSAKTISAIKKVVV